MLGLGSGRLRRNLTENAFCDGIYILAEVVLDGILYTTTSIESTEHSLPTCAGQKKLPAGKNFICKKSWLSGKVLAWVEASRQRAKSTTTLHMISRITSNGVGQKIEGEGQSRQIAIMTPLRC